MAAHEPSRVLLVEDNPDHTYLASLVMGGASVAHEVICAGDGQDALDRLRGSGPHQTPLRPALVLLDIKLPRVDGFGVLRQIREDQDLMTMPVVLLTTSGNPVDIERAVSLGANDYIIKPIGLNEFERKLHAVLSYWLSVSDLGRGRRPAR
jgi:two-component system response regulator